MTGKPQLWRLIAGLVFFSLAFGYVEASVVAYLRSLYAPLRAQFRAPAPHRPGRAANKPLTRG